MTEKRVKPQWFITTLLCLLLVLATAASGYAAEGETGNYAVGLLPDGNGGSCIVAFDTGDWSQLHGQSWAPRELLALPEVSPDNYAAISTDGRYIAYTIWSASGSRSLVVWDTASGQDSLYYDEGGNTQVRDISFLPDGETLVFLFDHDADGREQDLRTLNVNTGEEEILVRGGVWQAEDPELDDIYQAYGGEGDCPEISDSLYASFSAPRCLEDGSLLVYSATLTLAGTQEDGATPWLVSGIWTCDLETGESALIYVQPDDAAISQVEWSGEDTLFFVACQDEDGGGSNIYQWNLTEQWVNTQLTHSEDYYYNGNLVMTGTGNLPYFTSAPTGGGAKSYQLFTAYSQRDRIEALDIQYRGDTVLLENFVHTVLQTDVAGLPYTDVDADNWYYGDVEYAYYASIMGGVTSTTFAPEEVTTRAQVVTALWRMAGHPTDGDWYDGAVPVDFTDLTADWYTYAVYWAATNGIVEGYSADRFGPNDPVTREQLAVMLMRYADYLGRNVDTAGDLSGFTDRDQISTWAVEAMEWANALDLITGRTPDTLAPGGETSRAELAALLSRFDQTFPDPWAN